MIKEVMTGREFYCLLKFFQKQVEEKCYAKMPYDRWKIFMARWTCNDSCISIEWWENSRDYAPETFELINENYESYFFTANDDSFGTFLLDVFEGAWSMEEIMQGTSSKTYTNCNGEYVTVNGTSPYSQTVTKVNNGYYGSALNSTCVCSQGDSISHRVDKIENKLKDEQIFKEGDKNMKGFNFDFGFCTGDNVKMSIYGLAIKNTAGTYVAYDAKTDNVVDVDCFNFDGGKYMFKMPVAIKDIKKGDVVIHNRIPMFVIDTSSGIKVVDIREGEKKEIMPATNMFGFNFVTKVVSVFDGMQGGACADSPFGNMLPLFMMGESKGDNDVMLAFMMMQGQNGCTDMFSNPMMMYFMMKDGKNSDMLPLMMMMNMNKPVVEHECKCGSGCADHDHE